MVVRCCMQKQVDENPCDENPRYSKCFFRFQRNNWHREKQTTTAIWPSSPTNNCRQGKGVVSPKPIDGKIRCATFKLVSSQVPVSTWAKAVKMDSIKPWLTKKFFNWSSLVDSVNSREYDWCVLNECVMWGCVSMSQAPEEAAADLSWLIYFLMCESWEESWRIGRGQKHVLTSPREKARCID